MGAEAFWDSKKNIEPRYARNDKVWLFCAAGHEWETSKASYDAKRGCPYCAGNKVLVGFNDLATTHPNVASQWHPSLNEGLAPGMVSAGSNRKVWWLCSLGHSWLCSVKHRVVSNVECNVCSNRVIVSGVNDLEFNCPNVASQWHSTRNGGLLPSMVGVKSGKKVWWQCERGHEWAAKVVARVNGSGCPVCAGKRTMVGVNDFSVSFPWLVNEWNVEKNFPAQVKDFTAGSNRKVWWVCDKGHEWEATVADRTSGHGCKICKRSFSQPEEDLWEFLVSLGFDVSRNVKLFSSFQEVDFFIPEKQIAVEFNGLYWHSEAAGKTRFYHYDKWAACKEVGVQLVQVWEDDWYRNPELVKRMLAYKLGVAGSSKVYARKTRVKLLTQKQVDEFLDEYHIQGGVDGGIRVGLFEKITGEPFQEKLVAVMVLKREPGTDGMTLNLLRFATSKQVVGGFSKLLKHVVRTYAPKNVITFSDNTVSDGGLYANNGFTVVKELKPDYMYVVKGERVHKFNYRLKRFREDPGLKFVEGLSEFELAKLNGLPRVWDAGKTKWVLVP